jgi:DegV family protein with EDD domain
VVKVVTDSTADLLASDREALDIAVVPLNVHFGDQVYRDGVDLTGDEFFEKLKAAPQLPRTSQPSVGAFEEVYRRLTGDGAEVVAIHLSSKFSGTYQASLMAAQAVAAERITVVDSQTVTMAMGFTVIEAAKAAREGASRADIDHLLTSLIPKARLLGALDTLTYLERGGRIGRARAFLGSILNIKPIVTVRDGEVHPAGRARSRTQALDRLSEMLEREGPLQRLAVLHGAAPADAEKLRSRVQPRYPELEIPFTEIGPVIGTHAGPGVLGFTFLTR